MAQQAETRFSKKVRDELKKIRGVWFVKIQQVAKRGTPDYLICAGGVFIAAELKIPGEVPTPLQEFNLEAIGACGGVSRVITNKNLKEFLTEVEEYAEHYFEVSSLAKAIEAN